MVRIGVRRLVASTCPVLLAVAPLLAQDEGAATAETEQESVTQEVDEQDLFPLEEIVVTATRSPHETFDLPRSVTVADEVLLQRRNEVVALDALSERIGVWVEKRNGVSSDPVLRGFSGANILALVDGNSLTTLWGEGGYAGDDMYGKVDSESIERIEVVRGPASVLYGSNALGGAINFITRRPPDFTGGPFVSGGSFKTSFSSASNGVLLRGDTYGADDRFRYRLGYSMRDVGDTRGGGNLGLLSPSGIDESNFDWNSELRLSQHDTLEMNAQAVNRNGLSKYYRPTQRNDNDRTSAALRWRSTDTGLGDETSLSLYYQDKRDERTWLDKDQRGVATWRTLSSDLQTVSAVGDDHLLTWGAHFSIDEGESPDDEQFTISNPLFGTQKASPDSTWSNLGVYAHDEWSLSDDWTLTGSARVDTFRLEAEDNVFFNEPDKPPGVDNPPQSEPGTHDQTILSGGLGLVRHLSREWMAYASWARGFHLFPPGFGLRETGYGTLAPTDGFLEPTSADQFELGARVRRSWWNASVATYYSSLRDVQQPVYVEADDLWVIGGADGYVSGIELDTAIDLSHFDSGLDGWTWHNGLMLNRGRVEFDAGEEPLRHTHPPRFLTAARWEDRDTERGRWFEFVGDFVDRFDEVSESRLNNDVGYLNDPQDPDSGLIRPYGLPGYAVFHVRGGINLSRDTALTISVGNLFDREYRSAHSRMDAAGRNVMVGLRISF